MKIHFCSVIEDYNCKTDFDVKCVYITALLQAGCNTRSIFRVQLVSTPSFPSPKISLPYYLSITGGVGIRDKVMLFLREGKHQDKHSTKPDSRNCRSAHES